MKKALIITVSAVVILAVISALLVKLLVTPDNVKRYIIPAAEKSLNRKIDVGDISISLFSGIDLKDFSLREAGAAADLFKCGDFILKFRLLPLLAKQLIVDELRMVSPEINIIRNESGRFNFEGMGRQGTNKESNNAAISEGSAVPVSMLISKVSVENGSFSLKDFLRKLPDIKSTVNLKMKIKSAGPSGIQSSGKIDIMIKEADLHRQKAGVIRNVGVSLDYNAAADLKSDTVRIEKADLTLKDIKTALSGRVTRFRSTPGIEIHAVLPKTKASALMELSSFFTDVSDIKTSGGISADINLKGRPGSLKSMKARGSVMLHKVGIVYEKVDTVLNGRITLDRDLMDIDIKSTIEKNSAALKGSVRNYLGSPDIRLDLSSKKFDVDKVMAALGKGAETAHKAGRSASRAGSKKKAPHKKSDITASGTIKVDQAVFRGIDVANLHLKYSFKNDRLKITDMSAVAGKGKVGLTSTVDLSGPDYAYDMQGNMNSLHAEELINILFPKARDTIFGILSFNVKKLKGRGTTRADLKKHLFAEGDFSLQKGRITNSGIAERLSQFIQLGDLRTINIREAKGNFIVRNGIAEITSLFSSDDIEMDPHGSIGLDETLNLALNLKLSPRLTDKAMSSNIAQYIRNERGWGTIPLLITGTLSNPRYAVDVQKAGRQVIKKEVDKLFDKVFEDKDEQQKQQLGPVKELLKGIFQ